MRIELESYKVAYENVPFGTEIGRFTQTYPRTFAEQKAELALPRGHFVEFKPLGGLFYCNRSSDDSPRCENNVVDVFITPTDGLDAELVSTADRLGCSVKFGEYFGKRNGSFNFYAGKVRKYWGKYDVAEDGAIICVVCKIPG